jgi:uroporphyrinogen decarboxylase
VDTRRIGAQRIPGYPKNRRMEAEGETVIDFYGCHWIRNPESDSYFNQATFPLENYEILSENIDKLPRTNFKEFEKQLRNDLTQQIETARRYACIADRHTAGITENSLRIRGYLKWYMDTLLDETGVNKLFDIIEEDKIRYWDALIDWAIETGNETAIDVIAECDDLGSQDSTILHPDTLRRIVIPRFKRIFSHIKKRLPHVKIFMHSCGAIRPVLPDLIDAGLDVLNPVQFVAKGMDLKGLKKDFGRELTFWGGGIDTQNTLNHGTPEEVRDRVKRILDIMAPGGGFVFAPVHNVQDDVPPENFWAMWDTLQEYGKY